MVSSKGNQKRTTRFQWVNSDSGSFESVDDQMKYLTKQATSAFINAKQQQLEHVVQTLTKLDKPLETEWQFFNTVAHLDATDIDSLISSSSSVRALLEKALNYALEDQDQ